LVTFCVDIAYYKASLKEIYVRGRRGRRYKHLLDDLKETSVYGKLKREAQDRTVWKLTREEAVVRQIT
jgi:hypothetical protein